MIKKIDGILKNLLNALFFDRLLKGGLSLDALDLTDVFPHSMDELMDPGYLDGRFKQHTSMVEYNRDIMNILESHKREFYQDISSRDGHFRV